MFRIRTATLGAALVMGMASLAGAQTAAPAAPAGPAHAPRGPHGRHGMMASLNLTAAQKAQVKAIHEKYRSQFAQFRTAARPDMDAARAARQKGDTATARADMLKARGVMQQGRALRQQESAEIRAILTPTQQQKFDTQMTAMQKQHGKHEGRGKHKGNGKHRKTA